MAPLPQTTEGSDSPSAPSVVPPPDIKGRIIAYTGSAIIVALLIALGVIWFNRWWERRKLEKETGIELSSINRHDSNHVAWGEAMKGYRTACADRLALRARRYDQLEQERADLTAAYDPKKNAPSEDVMEAQRVSEKVFHTCMRTLDAQVNYWRVQAERFSISGVDRYVKRSVPQATSTQQSGITTSTSTPAYPSSSGQPSSYGHASSSGYTPSPLRNEPSEVDLSSKPLPPTPREQGTSHPPISVPQRWKQQKGVREKRLARTQAQELADGRLQPLRLPPVPPGRRPSEAFAGRVRSEPPIYPEGEWI